MRRTLTIVASITLMIAASCSDDEAKGSAATTTSAASATTTAAPAVTSTTAAGATTTAAATGKGCRTGTRANDIPSTTTIIDVDGDGHPDQGYVNEEAGISHVGILTAAGGATEVEIPTASPIALRVLVATIGPSHQVIALASDGRLAQLWTYRDCKLQPVLNKEGETYMFDLGPVGNGTGVGCIQSAEGLQLVGLLELGGDDTTKQWKRTPIHVDGTKATNGKSTTGTFTVGKDDDAIALLWTVSCGDATIAKNGFGDPRSGG